MTALKFRHVALGAMSCLLLGLSACETTDVPPYEPNASMGMLIARDNCASCHETFAASESPEPRAPSFRQIASRPGMTPETLSSWLRDAHNYPIDMGFSLAQHQADSLVAYIMSERAD